MAQPDDSPSIAPQAPSGDVARPTITRYWVLVLLCLAATIAYISRNSIGVAESTIREDLGLTKQQMGWVMSAFFVTYAFLQIPTGWFANEWGSRRALPIFSVAWSLATAMLVLAAGLPMLLAARLLNGAAQAGIFPASTNTISKWFPVNRQAMATGSLGSFMSAGGALGAGLTGVLVSGMDWQWMFVVFDRTWDLEFHVPGIGWQWMFVVYSVPGFIWALWFYLWFRDQPRQHPSVNEAELRLFRDAKNDDADRAEVEQESPAAKTRPSTPWLGIVSSPAMWWICAQQFCRGAGYMFFASWFPTYLQETRGVSIANSGFLTTLPLLAVVVGGISGGMASDWVLTKTGSRPLARQGVAGVSLLCCALLIFAAYWVDDVLLAVLLISVGSLFAAFAGPSGYTITIDMGGDHVATVHSTMNMCGNFGAMLFPLAVPLLIKATGGWDAVLFCFGGLYVVSAVCWAMMNSNGTIFDQSLIRS